jgi:MFS family permease
VEDRKLLICCMVVLLAGLVITIDYSYKHVGGSSYQHIGLAQYIVGASLIICGSIVTEIFTMQVLGKVAAPTVNLGILTAGVFSGFGAVLGRTLGNVIVGVCGLLFGEELIGLVMYSFLAVLCLILLVGVLFLYPKMQKLAYVQAIIEEDVKAPIQNNSSRVQPNFQPFDMVQFSSQAFQSSKLNIGAQTSQSTDQVNEIPTLHH